MFDRLIVDDTGSYLPHVEPALVDFAVERILLLFDVEVEIFVGEVR